MAEDRDEALESVLRQVIALLRRGGTVKVSADVGGFPVEFVIGKRAASQPARESGGGSLIDQMTLTDEKVLDVIRRSPGGIKVRQIMMDLSKWSQTKIKTVLDKLLDEGAVTRDDKGVYQIAPGKPEKSRRGSKAN